MSVLSEFDPKYQALSCMISSTVEPTKYELLPALELHLVGDDVLLVADVVMVFFKIVER